MLVEGEVRTGLGSVAVGSEVEASTEAMMDLIFRYCGGFEKLIVGVGVEGRG